MVKLGIPLVLFISIFLFVGGPNVHELKVYFEFWQLGHFGLFGIIILLLAQRKFVQRTHWAVQFIGTGIVCLILGLATEYLQQYFGRSFSLTDISNDIIGGYSGYFLAQAIRLSDSQDTSKRKRHSTLRLVYVVLILGLTLFAGRSFIKALVNEINIRLEFPVLSDFETSFERDRWQAWRARTEIGSQFARSGNGGIKITYLPARYPSLNLRDFNENWQDYSYLKLSLFNAQKTNVELILKIHDHRHHHTGYRFSDRFNKTIELAPGWNDLSFSLDEIKNSPNNRTMDMDQIFSFSLFMIRPKSTTTIYLDDVYLSQLAPQ